MTDMFYDDTMEDPQHHTRPELRICGHCCKVMRGYASLGDTWLCHTDEKSCYNAVTLHKHPMRCTVCDPTLAASVTWDEVQADMLTRAQGGSDYAYWCETKDCMTLLSDPANTVDGRCRAGNCVTLLCRGCRIEFGSFGPAGCPCQSRDPRINTIRAMYRAKKGRKR